MKVKAAVFDMDGTILDTLADLHVCTNFALRKNGFPERTLDEIRCFVGNGLRRLAERAVPADADPAAVDAVFADLKAHYAQHAQDYTKPYDGIIPLLLTLRGAGVKTAVVSNKVDSAVAELTAGFFPGLFDVSVGERPGRQLKPAPDAVIAALRELGVSKEDAVYIGDSEVDFATARNAGLPCISVTWGFRSREALQALAPDWLVDTPAELAAVLSDN